MARVLHIEDDPTNRLLVRKLLTAQGFEVIDAANGLEGVRAAIAQRPDIILVDINIPDLDGYEVTLRLRGEPSLAGVPIVAITAEGDREMSLVVGCDGFLQKPIDARTFPRTVSSYLGGERESIAPVAPVAREERLRQQSQRIVARLEAKVAELSAANTRLRELDRARTTFYRNVSHELATPMTPIVGYIRLLLDEELGALTKGQRRALTSMDDCVVRLRALIDNLLDVTALEAGTMRFVSRSYDIGDVVRRAVEASRPAFERREQRVSFEAPVGPLGAVGDPDRLGRAIGQLLDNAAKFTPDGGAAGVKIVDAGDTYAIVVADSGPGVPSDRAGELFQAFYQVDGSTTRDYGGVGVGLAIVRRVAEGLHGSVRVEPAGPTEIAGQRFEGATFVLTIARYVAS